MIFTNVSNNIYFCNVHLSYQYPQYVSELGQKANSTDQAIIWSLRTRL